MSNFFKKLMNIKIGKTEINYKRLNPKNWKMPSLKKVLRFLIILAIFLAACITLKDEYDYQFGGYYDSDYTYLKEGESGCNVSGIELYGQIVTYIAPEYLDEEGYVIGDMTSSESIISAIREAEADDSIKAVLLEIDSYGGSPVASYEINRSLHEDISKPVIVMVRESATSGAYLAAVASDTIFASPYSDIGGIGVTMSYIDYAKQNDKEGITYNSLSTGKYKDYGDYDKALTVEERSLIMRDLNIIHDNFVETVASDRNLEIEKVKALADGSSMPGQMAKDSGLIDELGSYNDVRNYLKEIIGEEANVCW